MTIIQSLIILAASSVCITLFRKSLGYLGSVTLSVCTMIFLNFNIIIATYQIYVQNITIKLPGFTIEQLGLNNNLAWLLEYSTFTSWLAPLVSFGGFIVLIYVYTDMNDDKEGTLFISQIQFFILFMLVMILSGHLNNFCVRLGRNWP